MIRVFYSDAKQCIVIDGVKSPFPAKSLTALYEGSTVIIWQPDGITPVVKADFSQIATEAGATFATLPLLTTYLADQFSRSPTEKIDGGFF